MGDRMKKTVISSGILIGLLSMVIFLDTAIQGNAATTMIERVQIWGENFQNYLEKSSSPSEDELEKTNDPEMIPTGAEVKYSKTEQINSEQELSSSNQAPENSEQEISKNKQEQSNSKNELAYSKQASSNAKQARKNFKQAPANSKQEMSNDRPALANSTKGPGNSNKELANSKQASTNLQQTPSSSKRELSNANQAPDNSNNDFPKMKDLLEFPDDEEFIVSPVAGKSRESGNSKRKPGNPENSIGDSSPDLFDLSKNAPAGEPGTNPTSKPNEPSNIFGDESEYDNIVSISTGNGQASLIPNPEPATFILFGLGLLGAAGICRRSFGVKS